MNSSKCWCCVSFITNNCLNLNTLCLCYKFAVEQDTMQESKEVRNVVVGTRTFQARLVTSINEVTLLMLCYVSAMKHMSLSNNFHVKQYAKYLKINFQQLKFLPSRDCWFSKNFLLHYIRSNLSKQFFLIVLRIDELCWGRGTQVESACL